MEMFRIAFNSNDIIRGQLFKEKIYGYMPHFRSLGKRSIIYGYMPHFIYTMKRFPSYLSPPTESSCLQMQPCYQLHILPKVFILCLHEEMITYLLYSLPHPGNNNGAIFCALFFTLCFILRIQLTIPWKSIPPAHAGLPHSLQVHSFQL